MFSFGKLLILIEVSLQKSILPQENYIEIIRMKYFKLKNDVNFHIIDQINLCSAGIAPLQITRTVPLTLKTSFK